jgi:diketogulonate reductase-like aldo/keto reductase
LIFRDFGNTGFKTSVIGMGTYYDPLWIAFAIMLHVRRGRKKKIDALKAGLDDGINFIDTAEIYQTEPLVGEAIKGRKRDELFIASKVWSNHLKPKDLEKSCKRSLARLGTSYLDLYQIHFPNSKVPIGETMAAMEKLLDEGLIRNVGVSNFSYRQMLEAESALKKYKLASIQMNYNLLQRDVEGMILPHCEKEKIAMIAYYPLAHGKLTGSSSSLSSHDAIEKICESRKITPAQVALAWLVSRSSVNFAIPRASQARHVREDALAGDIVLSSDEMSTLESL